MLSSKITKPPGIGRQTPQGCLVVGSSFYNNGERGREEEEGREGGRETDRETWKQRVRRGKLLP